MQAEWQATSFDTAEERRRARLPGGPPSNSSIFSLGNSAFWLPPRPAPGGFRLVGSAVQQRAH